MMQSKIDKKKVTWCRTANVERQEQVKVSGNHLLYN
jgi:hypothetical protein